MFNLTENSQAGGFILDFFLRSFLLWSKQLLRNFPPVPDLYSHISFMGAKLISCLCQGKKKEVVFTPPVIEWLMGVGC